jgi:hypothetical protein
MGQEVGDSQSTPGTNLLVFAIVGLTDWATIDGNLNVPGSRSTLCLSCLLM